MTTQRSIAYTSWQTIFSGAMFALVALSAAAAVVQLQISSIEARAEREKYDREKRDDQEKTDREKQDAFTNKEIEKRVTLDTFAAYQKGTDQQIDLVKSRLNYLEQTRPTTGELEAQARAMRDRIDQVYATLRSQEDWIRTRGPIPFIDLSKNNGR